MTESLAELVCKGLKKVAWTQHQGWTTEVYVAPSGVYVVRQFRFEEGCQQLIRCSDRKELFRKLPKLLPAVPLQELADRFALTLIKGGMAS